MESRGARAFLKLLGVLLVTGSGRALLERGSAPLPVPGVAASLEALDDSAAALARAEERRSRPLEPGETLDPNTAPEEELDRLPGVGPATAQAVIAARDTLPFRSLEELQRVRGLGPRTVERLGPWLEISPQVEARARRRPRLESGRPGRETATVGRILRESASGPIGKAPVPVNRASVEELQALPGIGPVLAQRMVERRTRVGPFTGEEDLLAVSGIGPALLARFRQHIRY